MLTSTYSQVSFGGLIDRLRWPSATFCSLQVPFKGFPPEVTTDPRAATKGLTVALEGLTTRGVAAAVAPHHVVVPFAGVVEVCAHFVHSSSAGPRPASPQQSLVISGLPFISAYWHAIWGSSLQTPLSVLTAKISRSPLCKCANCSTNRVMFDV